MKPRTAMLVAKALILTAAMIAGWAAPAWAGQNVSARIDFGALQTDVYGAFHHKGDWVQLVDSCHNKAVSYVQVRGPFSFTGGTKTYYVARAGDSSHRCGTRWINRNFREGRRIGIRVCNVAAGLDTCTSWRWGIA